MKSAAFALALIALFLALSASTASAQYLCTYQPNQNITSPDVAPKQFQPSSYGCCKVCTDTPACQAVVYDGYYCHLKGTTQTVVSEGATVINLVNPHTPSPGGVTTPMPTSPHTPIPTPQPMTNAPATPVPTPPQTPQPPQPITPAPTPQPTTVTMVRRVFCEYSHSCDQASDRTCTATAYEVGKCVNDGSGFFKFECTSSQVVKHSYSSSSCSGTGSTSSYSRDQCKPDSNLQYIGYYCDTVPAPLPGLTLNHGKWNYACGNNGQTDFTAGQCSNNGHGVYSGPLEAECYPSYVVFKQYSGSCPGNSYVAHVQPRDVCFMDQNMIHYKNTCSN